MPADQSGVGFDRDVGLVAVAVGADGLVDVAGLGIDGRDHPVRGGARAIRHVPSPSPGSTSWPATSANSPTASAASPSSSEALDGGEHGEGVVDQRGDELLPGIGVIPGDTGLARVVVVMPVQLQGRGLRGPAGAPGGWRRSTGSRCPGSPPRHRAPSSPTPGGSCPSTPRSRRSPPAPRRRSAPVLAGPQLVAPQRQHRRMEPLVGQRPTSGHLPGDVHPQLIQRVPVRAALQGLQHHHRRDHVRRAPTDGPAPTRTDRRTSRRGTAADDAPPRTHAPTPPAQMAAHRLASNNSTFGSLFPAPHQSRPAQNREHHRRITQQAPSGLSVHAWLKVGDRRRPRHCRPPRSRCQLHRQPGTTGRTILLRTLTIDPRIQPGDTRGRSGCAGSLLLFGARGYADMGGARRWRRRRR